MGSALGETISQIPDQLWSRMAALLPPRKAHPLGCHNPRIPDRTAMTAILFVLRTGCQWSALNETGICHYSSAYRRFREWTAAGVFLRFWEEGLLAYDELKGIDWRWLAADGAMTKAPLGGEAAGHNPTDRAKSGTKRSILVDAKGIPLAIAIDGANRHDSKLLIPTMLSMVQFFPQHRRPGLCLDKAYYDRGLHAWLYGFGVTPHVRSRGEEQRAIRKRGYKARRWVVERTHSWMNRFRRLLVRWEKRADTYLAMLHFALGIITNRLSGILGDTT